MSSLAFIYVFPMMSVIGSYILMDLKIQVKSSVIGYVILKSIFKFIVIGYMILKSIFKSIVIGFMILK